MANTPDQPPRFPSDRSERAKAMVQAGLFGGAGRGQGRKPKNRTAGAEVADLASRESNAIKKAFSDGLRSKNERTRLMAAKDLLAEERRELERREADAEFRRMSGPELDLLLAGMLLDLMEDGKLPADIHIACSEIGVDAAMFELASEDVVDGTAHEIPASANGAGKFDRGDWDPWEISG